DAARREFTEELGLAVPPGELCDLGTIRQSSSKQVIAWAIEVAGDDGLDLDAVASNTFELEWPPRSGRIRSFPEIDRAAWFGLDAARPRLVGAQDLLLDRLVERIT
ncbi:MAG: DNA mismatch repair protein MutT, partial [Actinomycetota bacterium]